MCAPPITSLNQIRRIRAEAKEVGRGPPCSKHRIRWPFVAHFVEIHGLGRATIFYFDKMDCVMRLVMETLAAVRHKNHGVLAAGTTLVRGIST